MTHTRWLALLLAAVALLIPTAAVQAQTIRLPSTERKEYAHFGDDSDLSQILSNKLLEMRGRLELDRLRKEYGDKLKFLKLDKWKLSGFDAKNFTNPALQKQIKDLLNRSQKDAKISPEGVKAIESLIKNPPVPEKNNSPEPNKGTGEAVPPQPGDLKQGPGPNDATNPSGRTGTFEPDLQEKLAEWAKRVADRLEGTRLGERLRDSAAWQNGMQSLDGFLSDYTGGAFSLPGGALEGLSNRLHLPKDWSSLLPNFDRLHLPEFALPSLQRPHLNVPVPRFNVGAPRLPGGFSGGGGPGLGGMQAILWAGLIALLALLLWRLARKPTSGDPRAATGWRPGPWPVNPALVSTRADLVQAFEYLALLRLGQEARVWNHRDIAAHLSGTDATREQAASELAALYEQARYAPDDETLAAPDLEAARRNLCFLAGVATA